MKTRNKKKGFTIVELLTVMAIIALLLAILTPALSMVRKIAKDTAQRAQFHSVDVALEAYSGDIGEYPPSQTLPWDSASNEPGTPAEYTVGAMHLAEALIGRDLLGFDPWSSGDAYADSTGSLKDQIYAKSPPGKIADVNASLDRRKGPYLDVQNAGAYQIHQLYSDKKDVFDNNSYPAPVLTDIYYVKTISSPGSKTVKAGSPILYYRANLSTKTFYNSSQGTHDVTNDEAATSIFDSQDNEPLLDLPALTNNSEHHFKKGYNNTQYGGRDNFYDMITNPSITTQVRPYNQTTYILMSAGYDGIFGTPDDIYNFKQ